MRLIRDLLRWAWFLLVYFGWCLIIFVHIPNGYLWVRRSYFPTEEELFQERRNYENALCERTYFDPTCIPYGPPFVFKVEEPDDFKRAWEFRGPVIILFDYWPMCHEDGSWTEGNMRARILEPNEGR